MGVDLELAADLLLQVATEHLDVAGLVDDLRAAYSLASYHGTDSVIFAVHNRAPCSPWRNCDRVHRRWSMAKAIHSSSVHFSTTVPS